MGLDFISEIEIGGCVGGKLPAHTPSASLPMRNMSDIIYTSGEHGPKNWEQVIAPGRQGDPDLSGAPTCM